MQCLVGLLSDRTYMSSDIEMKRMISFGKLSFFVLLLALSATGCATTESFRNNPRVFEMERKIATRERATMIVRRVIALPLQKEYPPPAYWRLQVDSIGIHDSGSILDSPSGSALTRSSADYSVRYADDVTIELVAVGTPPGQDARYIIEMSSSLMNRVFFACPARYKDAVVGALLILFPHAR